MKVNWSKVTHFEKIEPWGNSKTVYFSRLDTWKGPMFIYHMLRHTAIFLDESANAVRKIIFKFTDSYDIQDHIKFRNIKFK